MIVVDSSAWVDWATNGGSARLYDALGSSGHWVVPQHFRLEAMNAARGLWLGRHLSAGEFDEVVEQLGTADLDEWPTASLIPRIRELAANANAYDAAYVALAEELGCAIVAADAKLARIPGIRCRVLGFDESA